MATLIQFLLVFTFTHPAHSAQNYTRPRPIISMESCESFLLSRKGGKMVASIRDWFTGLPKTSLQVDHVPVFSIDPVYLQQPYEFFLEENQDRPFMEVFAEYNQRQLQKMEQQLEDMKSIKPLTLEEAQAAAEAHLEARNAEKLTQLEKVALGLSTDPADYTLGDLKEVRISGNKEKVILVTIDKNNVPKGRVEIPLENIRLGFKNTLASWQAARYIENPQAFTSIGAGERAVRRFLADQGRVLLERPTNGVRLGYLFEFNQTTSKRGQPDYVSIRIVTIRDCDRPSVGRHEIIFPKAGLDSGHLSVCAALTEITLQTP